MGSNPTPRASNGGSSSSLINKILKYSLVELGREAKENMTIQEQQLTIFDSEKELETE